MAEIPARSFHPPARTLMGPGPSDVPPRVLAALARPTLGHLDPAFGELMDDLKRLLRAALRTENDVTFAVSAPGSAGMELCFANLVEPGDRVVICRNGVFGSRMEQNVLRAGGKPVLVDSPWGRACDPQTLQTALRATPDARLVAFVHAETSTGAASDAQTLAAIAHEHDCLVLVDAVTSLGGSPLEMDAWGIDALYSGSQKCLSCTPGLSPVSFGPAAVERVRARATPPHSWFLDLSLLLGYWAGDGGRTYHHTAPVNALYGLHEALVILHEEGLEASWARHQRLHEALRDGLEAMGLELPVPAGERLPQLNLVRIPDGVDDRATRAALLARYGLEIGAGLGDFAGKAWRIGLMGASASERNVMLALGALHQLLGEQQAVPSDSRPLDAARARLNSGD